MEQILDLLKSIWISFKRLIVDIFGSPKEISQESPKVPEQQSGEQQATQQPQREIARSVPLNITSTDLPRYQKSKSLLTKAEHNLYRALIMANNGQFALFAKVRMGDFVFLANEPQDRKYHANQVFCKHVDFLLCDNYSLEPLLAIELDDSSHKQYENYERDEFKNKTFHSVGLPVLRINIQQEYSAESLRTRIAEMMSTKSSINN